MGSTVLSSAGGLQTRLTGRFRRYLFVNLKHHAIVSPHFNSTYIIAPRPSVHHRDAIDRKNYSNQRGGLVQRLSFSRTERGRIDRFIEIVAILTCLIVSCGDFGIAFVQQDPVIQNVQHGNTFTASRYESEPLANPL